MLGYERNLAHGGVGEIAQGVGIGGQQGASTRSQGEACLGRRKLPRGPFQKAGAGALLEPGQHARDGRCRAPQAPGRCRETAFVDDGDEDGQFIESIHDCSTLQKSDLRNRSDLI
jgi:hypothetical protein